MTAGLQRVTYRNGKKSITARGKKITPEVIKRLRELRDEISRRRKENAKTVFVVEHGKKGEPVKREIHQ